MCGISLFIPCSICRKNEPFSKREGRYTTPPPRCPFSCREVIASGAFEVALRGRGPDSVSSCIVKGLGYATATVLHLRGSRVCGQPLVDAKENMLLWNGQVFGEFPKVSEERGDTVSVFECLRDQMGTPKSTIPNSKPNSPSHILHKTHGPFSIIYWDAGRKTLWYGKDPMGRRSLLVATINTNPNLSPNPNPNSDSNKTNTKPKPTSPAEPMESTQVKTFSSRLRESSSERKESSSEPKDSSLEVKESNPKGQKGGESKEVKFVSEDTEDVGLDGPVIISSVSIDLSGIRGSKGTTNHNPRGTNGIPFTWTEVPVGGLFSIEVSHTGPFRVSWHMWSTLRTQHASLPHPMPIPNPAKLPPLLLKVLQNTSFRPKQNQVQTNVKRGTDEKKHPHRTWQHSAHPTAQGPAQPIPRAIPPLPLPTIPTIPTLPTLPTLPTPIGQLLLLLQDSVARRVRNIPGIKSKVVQAPTQTQAQTQTQIRTRTKILTRTQGQTHGQTQGQTQTQAKTETQTQAQTQAQIQTQTRNQNTQSQGQSQRQSLNRSPSQSPLQSQFRRQVERLGSQAVEKPASCNLGPGLSEASQSRSRAHARVALLFSGGVDCMVLAKLVDLSLDIEETIDLINVAFTGDIHNQHLINSAKLSQDVIERIPDRAAGIAGVQELMESNPNRHWNFIEVNVTTEELESHQSHILALLHPRCCMMDFNIASILYFASFGSGLVFSPGRMRSVRSGQVRYGDVENLAFELYNMDHRICQLKNEAVVQPPKTDLKKQGLVQGLLKKQKQGLAQGLLKKPKQGLAQGLKNEKQGLDKGLKKQGLVEGPKRRRDGGVSDGEGVTSEGVVLKKAKNGCGRGSDCSKQRQCISEEKGEYFVYRSRAKVFLSGLGADELFAGYGRHRTAFLKHGKDALIAELNKDIGRLWQRNLARDDRMVSAFGRESRHPFLDRRVMSHVCGMDIQHICRFNLRPGEGDKFAIRAIALHLGLPKASVLLKRAMQFGTRIANSKVPGQQAITEEMSVRGFVNKQFLSKHLKHDP